MDARGPRVKSVCLSLFLLAASCVAVDTREIEQVRAKSVLDSQDLRAIDNFVASAVKEIVETRDFSSVSNARSIIVAYSTGKEAAQVQYAQQFSESAFKHISAALSQAKQIRAEQDRFKVTLNLLMLVDGLEDPRVAEAAIPYLKDSSEAIRYWAVHVLTGDGLTKKLEAAPGGAESGKRIAGLLAEAAERSGPETLAMMVGFAAKTKTAESEQLLIKIADARIKSYADWSVEGELFDSAVIGALAERMKSSNPNKAELGRRMGQLLSYAIQRYVKGQVWLTPSEKEQLVSVLVDAEKVCVTELAGKPQLTIRRAVEGDNVKALMDEHNRLLGSATDAGLLPTVLGFNYGKTDDGQVRTAPAVLGDPPK